MVELEDIRLDNQTISKEDLECYCWRRWYPYATLIHREGDSETLDAISSRLELAMELYDPVIVVRCFHIGEIILAWIKVGHTVRDTASVLSLSSLVLNSLREDHVPLWVAITGFSLQVLHSCIWEHDRLSGYEVQPTNKLSEQDCFKELQDVVLVRKPKGGKLLLRTAVTVSALGICAYFYYKKVIVV